MSATIYDAEASVLLVPGQTVTTNTTFSPITFPVWLLETASWVIAVSAISTSGTTTLALQVATSVAQGNWVEVASFAWPSTLGPTQLALPVNGSKASVAVSKPGAARLVLTQTGLASITLRSWLTKA